jgi:signal transduction histidine kinase
MLAGEIAHDFNNILGAILGYGELVQRATPAGSAERRYIDNVMEAGGRAKSLVECILAFSRTGVGDHAPINAQAVIEEVLELLAASLAPGVRLETRLEGGNEAILHLSNRTSQRAYEVVAGKQRRPDIGGR